MAAGRTLKTLGNFIARSGNVVKPTSISLSNSLFTRSHKVLLQPNASYRAAVLHEIAKPLVVEDVTSTTKLKDLEVGHCINEILFVLHFIVDCHTGSNGCIHLWS